MDHEFSFAGSPKEEFLQRLEFENERIGITKRKTLDAQFITKSGKGIKNP